MATEQFEQRSEEWFQWRNKGIGSSDSSILMGLNKYKTVKQLWLEKTNQVQAEFTSPFLAVRGTNMELQARESYCKYKGIEMVDKLFEHPKYKFIRASLDGWNEERKKILEIKCPKWVNHYRAVAENWIKPEYYCQMQHQYLASPAKSADYWSFDGRSGFCIPVEPDSWFMGELLEREIDFWECVESMKEPVAKRFAKPTMTA